MTTDDGDEGPSSPPEDPVENDDEPSRFAHLLERIEDRNSSKSRENRSKDEDPSHPPEERVELPEPLNRVRELLPDTPDRTSNARSSPAEASSSSRKPLLVGIAVGISIAVVLPGFALASVGHVTDTILAPSPDEYLDEHDTLYVHTEDAAYLNRIFEETTYEVAYCGLITDDRETPRLEIWMANSIDAGPDHVAFITDNCPAAFQEVLLHTHPSGTVELSEVDRRTLEQRPERFMCVQGGPIATEPDSAVENLACYRQLDDVNTELQVTRISVRTIG